jgi:oxidoreductase
MSTKKNLKALICGHTGATGQALLDALITSPDYESIVAVGRRESVAHRGEPKLKQHVIENMVEMSTTKPDIADGCNVAFCCIGTTFNDVFKKSKAAEYQSVDFGIATEFAKLAKLSGVEFFAIITGDKSDSKSQFRMTKVKGETEDFVISLGFPRVAILRPGLLNRGKGRRGWMERVGTLWGIFGLPVQKLAQSMVWMNSNQTDSLKRYETIDIRKAIKSFESSHSIL